MKKWMLVLKVVALLLPLNLVLVNAVEAQNRTALVALPVHGLYAFPIAGSSGKPDTLNLLDTFSGDVQVIASNDRGISSPVWNGAGDQIAFQQGRIGSSIWNISHASVKIVESFSGWNSLFFPQSWSADGTQILYLGYSSKTDPPSDQLHLYNLKDDVLQTLFDFKQGQLLDGHLPLPNGFSDVGFADLVRASWNPVYQDWIIVQYDGLPPENQSDTGIGFNMLYNLATGEKILLEPLIDNAADVDSAMWSPDGNYLFLNSSNLGSAIFQFSVSDHTFQLVKSTSDTQGQTIVHWFGVGDLFIAAGMNAAYDAVYYVGEIAHGQWHSTEFFRLPPAQFGNIQDGDWHISASDAEKQALIHLFDQEAKRDDE